MKLTDKLSPTDFQQQYESTYCTVKHPEWDLPLVGYCGSVYPSISNSAIPAVEISFENKEPTVYLSYSTEYDIQFPIPRNGLYNLGRGTIHINRNANKQFKKGFGKSVAEVTPGITLALRELNASLGFQFDEAQYKKHLYTILWKWPGIKAVFFPFYPAFNELLFEFKQPSNKNYARALSRNWQIVLSRTSKYPLELYHGILPVGYFIDYEHLVIDSLFKQEFSDLLRRQGVYINVQEA